MLAATPAVMSDVEYYLPDKQSTKKMADFFSAFSDPSRLRILSVLAISPMCVTDVSQVLEMNQTTVSHQLRTLRDMGLVDFERRGKIVFYKLSNQKINEILLIGVEYLGY